MFARQRFSLYRMILGIVTAKGFDEQQVWPLETPVSEHIDVDPLTPEFPPLVRRQEASRRPSTPTNG